MSSSTSSRDSSARPMTFAEKALAKASGRLEARAGEILQSRPDIVLSHDASAAIARIFRELGVERVAIPERMAITLDHAVPAPTTNHARNHAEIRRFVREQGVAHFFEVGRGICHQVLSEEAIVLPGQVILGGDSHTPHFGWMGAFGAGLGRSEIAVLWATGEIWLQVPETIAIAIDGTLSPWVSAKDIALQILGQHGAEGGRYCSVELTGSAVNRLSVESRMVLANMMAEFGVKNSYLPVDESVLDYLVPRLARRLATDGEPADSDELRHRLVSHALAPDPDAVVRSRHHVDASKLEPLVAAPHSPDNVVRLSELESVRVDQAFVGTCTNGRIEDLEAVHRIVAGRRVASGTRLLIIPASDEVLRYAVERGWMTDLMDAGATFGTPGCGPCMGNHMGVPAPGEVCISSANRNFRGRMGTNEASVYLASPAVVAASAIAGRVAHPEEVMS